MSGNIILGRMIRKIRTLKGISATDVANLAGIDTGHLSHIEKGNRNPSHETLGNICRVLEIPYQPMSYLYDTPPLSEEQESYNVVDHILYNKVLLVNNISGLVTCPHEFSNSSIALTVPDNSMEPNIHRNSVIFIEFSSPLNSGDIGLFNLDSKTIIRKFIIENNKIILKANNIEYPDIKIDDDSNFYIIGKVHFNM